MSVLIESREKPCHDLGYCPYGVLVEDFPLSKPRTEKSCKVFGHDCPFLTCAEDFKEAPAGEPSGE